MARNQCCNCQCSPKQDAYGSPEVQKALLKLQNTLEEVGRKNQRMTFLELLGFRSKKKKD